MRDDTRVAICFPSRPGVPRLHVTPSHMFWKLPSEPGLAMTSAGSRSPVATAQDPLPTLAQRWGCTGPEFLQPRSPRPPRRTAASGSPMAPSWGLKPTQPSAGWLLLPRCARRGGVRLASARCSWQNPEGAPRVHRSLWGPSWRSRSHGWLKDSSRRDIHLMGPRLRDCVTSRGLKVFVR